MGLLFKSQRHVPTQIILEHLCHISEVVRNHNSAMGKDSCYPILLLAKINARQDFKRKSGRLDSRLKTSLHSERVAKYL